jgi:hypothetical protein
LLLSNAVMIANKLAADLLNNISTHTRRLLNHGKPALSTWHAPNQLADEARTYQTEHSLHA